MASTGRVMEKPGQEQQALKCPRCDSSNTKFCYYNNYSLSQPRHFCKACKRYWTRGGTLRNVPVGGGCRKNKRVKRPASSVDAPSSAPTAALNPPLHPRSTYPLRQTMLLLCFMAYLVILPSSIFHFQGSILEPPMRILFLGMISSLNWVLLD